MRQRFEQQSTLGIVQISEVTFPLRSRDEMPAVLKGLQQIFITPELNQKIFSILEEKVCGNKKRTGRPGMDLWHILVLAVVRHALDTNWDKLEDLANNHHTLRKILGVHAESFVIDEDKIFGYQTILDNVSLLDEETLMNINLIVSQYGHKLVKKKEEDELRLKTDSFVLPTNVHFPTDLNLLWDALRKCLDTVEKLGESVELKNWRKVKSIRRNIKRLFRSASQQVFGLGKKNEAQVFSTVKAYLHEGKKLQLRFEEIFKTLICLDPVVMILLTELQTYNEYVKKQIDLAERRLLMGEVIPAEEKIHSIFEPHTEMIKKGKLHPNIELGHMLLITSEQNNFIVDYFVMENEKDAAQVRPLTERILKNIPNKKVHSHSFDKGFYSKENYEILLQAGVENVILPKKGKRNKEEEARENNKTFKTLRNAHSAVESNINMLEHHGLGRCPDKGLKGYKTYVGLCVLAYNLHLIGNFLLAKEKEKEQKRKKQRNEYYRQAA